MFVKGRRPFALPNYTKILQQSKNIGRVFENSKHRSFGKGLNNLNAYYTFIMIRIITFVITEKFTKFDLAVSVKSAHYKTRATCAKIVDWASYVKRRGLFVAVQTL